MASLIRLIALGLCGALGVGLAICVATSVDVLPDPSVVSPSETTAKSDGPSLPAQAKVVPKPSPNVFEPPELPPVPPIDAIDKPVTVPKLAGRKPPFAQQADDLVNRLEKAIGQITTEQVDRKKSLDQTLKSIKSGDISALMDQAQSPDGPSLGPPKPAAVQSATAPVATPPPAAPVASAPQSRPVRADIKRIPGEGDNDLSIHIQDSDIREVLDLLSEQGNLNILASNSVEGKVSASLKNVDIDTALKAILKSTGFVARREGEFIYVGTPKDFQSMEESVDKLSARIYRPNYIQAADLQALIQPLLTPQVGIVSVTTPAGSGIAADGSSAGGDGFAGGEAVLVKDYEAVLAQVDQVFEELDKRPMQVAIEAMILSVKLADKNDFGVDFALLRNEANVRLVSGAPLTDLATMRFDGGLKFGFLDSSLGVFINALETIGDTNVIATPRLMCINKHKAEILIGSQLGYVNTTLTETSTAQNVQFLEVGTQLRLRPFISSDGLIRMEVHPELSKGSVRVEEGFTLPDKELTQVTTNIMVRDGCTVIIGGLLREDLNTTTSQIPLLGSAPGIGWLFRQKKEVTERQEIIVLVTPHIVYEPTAAAEGNKAACEFHRREAVYADHMSPIGTRYLGRKYFRMAQDRWARNDRVAALRMIVGSPGTELEFAL